MRPVKVHKLVRMNLHNLQSLMNSILIGKTPGIVISLDQSGPKGFSGPNILNFLNHFSSNFLKGPGRFWRTHLIFLISWCSIDGSDSNLVQKVANSDGSFEKIRRKSILRFFIPRQGHFVVT